MAITRADVDAAAERISPWVRRTPVVRMDDVVLKLEHLQHTGSFKPRGMFNRLLTVEVPDAGIVIASGGNAGLAAAYAATALGHRSTVFVPANAPASKVDRLLRTATDVRLVGASYAEALVASEEHARDSGAVVLHAYDQDAVVAGQGTLALELAEQAEVDTVLVAVGGGGLIGGVAAACGDHVRVIAVETAACPTLHAALDAGAPVDVEVGGIAADSLGARRIGDVCWSVRHLIASSVLVGDDDVRVAQRVLWDQVRQVAEPGGATALAAVLSGAYVPGPRERVAVVVCGANTSPGAA